MDNETEFDDTVILYEFESEINTAPIVSDYMGFPYLVNFSDIYSYVKKLGSGSYATTKLYQKNETGENVAIKEFDLNRDFTKENLLNEAEMLKILSFYTDGIPKYYTHFIFKNRYGQYFFAIVMEYIEGISLEDYSILLERTNKTIPEKVFVQIAIQLFKTLVIFHEHNFVHRDIKPENIIWQKNRLVLLDLGLSCKSGNEDDVFNKCNGRMGTPLFMAPELFADDDTFEIVFNKNMDYEIFKKSDVWSAGVTLYFIINKAIPWKNVTTISQLKSQVVNTLFKIEINTTDNKLKNLFTKILQRSPFTRYSALEVYNSLVSIMETTYCDRCTDD